MDRQAQAKAQATRKQKIESLQKILPIILEDSDSRWYHDDVPYTSGRSRHLNL
jgi:hypothetical protein